MAMEGPRKPAGEKAIKYFVVKMEEKCNNLEGCKEGIIQLC